LATAVEGLTEKEARVKRRLIQKKTIEDIEIYTTILKLYMKYKEHIITLNKEIESINTLIIKNQTKSENKKLSSAQRKLLEKELMELRELLKLFNNILEFKMIENNEFLLENEGIIIENTNFKQDIREQLLELINQFKQSGLVGTLQNRRQSFYSYLLRNEELIKKKTILKELTKILLKKMIEKAKTELPEQEIQTVEEEVDIDAI
jgi:hypothetical protein